MKTFILIITLFIGSVVYSQVSDFQFESSKIYPNGKKIAYFYIEGVKESPEAFYIQTEIVEMDEIKRFFIYKGDSKRRCMFEGVSTVDESFLLKNINKIISEYKLKKESYKENKLNFYLNLLSISDFPEKQNTGTTILDNENYKKAIELWGSKNPQKYQMLKESDLDLFSN